MAGSSGGFAAAPMSSPVVDWEALKPDSIVPATLLVGYKPVVGDQSVKMAAEAVRNDLHAKVGATLRHRYSLIPLDSVLVPQGMSLKEAAAIYAADPGVAYVEPNYKLYPTALPNDPGYSMLWGMPRIHAPEAWDVSKGSKSILVAVIDTGILRTHQDLAANMWQNPGETGLDSLGRDKATNGVDDDGNGFIDDVNGWDFINNDNNPTDDQGHGTHCAGTIGGVGNNGKGVVGVNWNVSMVALKFMGTDGGSTENAIRALQYAVLSIPGVRLTSNSWGGTDNSTALKNAIDAAGGAGQLFIAAAGNDSVNNDTSPHYPSSYTSSNLISVASIDSDGSMSYFSNYGSNSVDLAAPGGGIYSTTYDGGYGTKSGTSMATPHVAGAAALLWSVSPASTWREIRAALLNNARPNAALAGKMVTGGELDVAAAINTLNPPVLNPSPVYVVEGAQANVEVTLLKEPGTNVTVSVAWFSGSTNLYVVGSPALEFTPSNWSNVQTFAVGSLIDIADQANDTAVFRVTAEGSGGAEITAIQKDLGDTLPPQCVITGSLSSDRSIVSFDFKFDESVTGFDTNDISVLNNVIGGINFIDFIDVTGVGQHYQLRYAIAAPMGALQVTVPAGSLTDLSGNANSNEQYQFTYTLPWVKNDFFDDMEGGVGGWTVSTQAMAGIQTKAWEWGIPTYIYGPSANSGTHCWGTVMTNVYPNNMNSWLMSPSIQVGVSPTLDFYLWLDLEPVHDVGYVEVYDGFSWVNVTPGDAYTGVTGGWFHEQIALDNAAFGSRSLKVRFKTLSNSSTNYAGMYVDDVRVQSQRDPGLWLVSCSPTNAPAGTTNPLTFTIYNSLPTTVSASADISSPDFGVTVLSGSPVSYGLVAPGEVVTSLGPVMLQLDAAGNFDSPVISLFHQARNGSVAQVSEAVSFIVDGVSNSVSTNALTVRSLLGVTDWLGGFLTGNGGATSAIFQVIYAGPDGLKNAPQGNGQVTGDDRILYSTDVHLPYGRIGEGVGILPNAGSFLKTFSHNLSATAKVYVRAWNAASFAASAAYGDSALYTLTAATNQTHDYGRWAVANPAPGSFGRDTDGDSLSDGWCVLHGLSANNPIVPLACKVIEAKSITDVSFPNRVAVSSNFVFIADMNNKRVQVWDRALTTRKFVLGATSGAAGTNFGFPRGLAVTRDGTRVAVADTGNSRVRLFSVNPVSGTLSSLFDFGSNGTNDGQFNRPMAVAFGSADEIYVADSDQSAAVCNNRVQVFNSNGVFQSTFGTAGSNPSEFQRLLGVGMGADGTLYAADGMNNRVQAFTAGSTFAWEFGTSGTGVGQFNRVWDAQPGLNKMLYVCDSYNNRIQVVNLAGAPSVAVSGVFTNAGSLGVFNFPQSAAAAPDDHVLYVADTLNNRVLRLKVTMDADGDGMDDVWEVLHGLNPQDPSDAFGDPDGDGTLNIGEYRAGTDPQSGTPGINLKISSIVVAQGQLSWLALSGYVYRVQTSTNLMQNAWVDGMTTTSMVDGALVVTNQFPNTNPVDFMRVLWINAP
ncbi:MAG: S8 family serine peptidase [bacterium]